MSTLDDNTEDRQKVATQEPSEAKSKITPIDYSNSNDTKPKFDNLDFGDMLTSGESSLNIRRKVGGAATLSSKEYYQNDEKLTTFLKNKYGEENFEDTFDTFYKNMQGEYVKYLQDDFEAERFNEALSASNFGAQNNQRKKVLNDPVGFLVSKTMDKSLQIGDKFFGEERSNREAMVMKARIVTGKNDDGSPKVEEINLTPENKQALLDTDGIDGFAYNRVLTSMGNHARADGFVDVIIDGKVWDDVSQQFKNVRDDQIVSNWDVAPDTLLAKFMKGNDIEMAGLEYAKILPRTFSNLAIDFLNIIPQFGRGIMGAYYGEEAENIELYNRLTSMGIQLKSGKTSISDEAIKNGVWRSPEMMVGTVADVAAQLILAGGISKLAMSSTKLAARGVAAVGEIEAAANMVTTVGENMGGISRLILTMLATKDSYQDALEHGFTKKQAGVAMGATLYAMWKANLFSEKVINGPSVDAAKYYSKKLAKNSFAKAERIFIKQGKPIPTEFLIKKAEEATTKTQLFLDKITEKILNSEVLYSAANEAVEEILEDLSTEAVHQMMNGYISFRGADLHSLTAGNGRYKSYWDKNYWKDLVDQLLISGVAGGLGGPIGKVMHGGAKLTKFSNESKMLDFILSGHSDILKQAIVTEASQHTYGPKGVTSDIDPVTGSLILGNSNTINSSMKKILLQDLAVLDTFVKDMGLDKAKDMLDGDKHLKDHINKTSLLNDTVNIATELRQLLDSTGLGTATLKAINDGDIDEALRTAKEENASYREKLENDVENFENIINTLDTKPVNNSEDTDDTTGESTSEENDTSKEVNETNKDNDNKSEEELLRQELVTTKSLLTKVSEGVEEKTFNRIQELVREVRAINNLSAAETYYLQYTYYDHKIFGSKQNRDPKYMKYDQNFFKNSFKNSRDTMRLLNLEQIERFRKMQDNDKRILKMNADNLSEFEDIFDGKNTFMSEESFKLLKTLKDELEADDTKVVATEAYIESNEYADLVLDSTIQNMSQGEFKEVEIDNPDGTTTILHENKKGITLEFIDFLKTDTVKKIWREQVKATKPKSKGKIYLNILKFNSTHVKGYHKFVTSEKFRNNKVSVDVYAKRLVSMGTTIDQPENLKISIGDTEESRKVVATINMLSAPDQRLVDINKFYSLAHDIKQGDALTPSIPKMHDTFNAQWYYMDIKFDDNNKFKTVSTPILESIHRIKDAIEVADGENGQQVLHLDSATRAEIAHYKQVVEIRKAQRDIVRNVMYGYNPLDGGLMIDKIASFRENTLKIIGKNIYPTSMSFSQKENHIYKDHTVLSDFINDFLYDPREISRIAKKEYTKQPLTTDEQELLDSYKIFDYTLRPVLNNERLRNEEEDEIKIIDNIEDMNSLKDAVSFMYKYGSLEQAEIVLDGMDYLLNEFSPEKIKITGSKLLDSRKEYSAVSADVVGSDSVFSDQIDEIFEKSTEEKPKELQVLQDALDSPDNKVKSRKNAIEIETALYNFIRIIPELKKNMSDIQFNSIINLMEKHVAVFIPVGLHVFSNFDIEEFYSRYLRNLDADHKRIPDIKQELNAAMAVGFMLSQGMYKNGTPIHFMSFNGIGGAGKTQMLLKTAISMAQEIFVDKYGKSNSGIIYASNHTRQINMVKAALESGGVDLTNSISKDFKGVIAELDLYLDNPNDKENTSNLDSKFLIVYDEYTGINAKPKENQEQGEESIHTFISRINRINKIRVKKGLQELKVMLLGDESQTGWGAGSSISNELYKSDQLTGISLTHNFRISNRFIETAHRLVRHPFTIKTKYNRDSVRTLNYGKPKNSDRLAGVRIISNIPEKSVGGALNIALDDQVLADDIVKQMDDPEFTVGIISVEPKAIDNKTAIGKLIDKYPDRIEVVHVDEVKGSEFNYIISEFSESKIGNYEAVSDKDQVNKEQYTIVSRAKDFAKIVNNNNAPFRSIEINNELIVPAKDDEAIDTELIYEHIKEVYKDVKLHGKKEEAIEEENKNLTTDINKEIIIDDNYETSFNYNDLPSKSLIKSTKELEDAFVDKFNGTSYSKDHISKVVAYLLNLDEDDFNDIVDEELEYLLKNEDIINADLIAKNRDLFKALYSDYTTLISNESTRIQGIVSSLLIEEINPQYKKENVADAKEVKRLVIGLLSNLDKYDSTAKADDINVDNEVVQRIVDSTIAMHIAFVNGLKIETIEPVKRSVPEGKDVTTVDKGTISKRLQTLLEKYGTVDELNKISRNLSIRVTDKKNPLSIDEYKELQEIEEVLHGLKSMGQYSFRRLDTRYVKKPGSKSKGNLSVEHVNFNTSEIKASTIYAMRMNQPHNGGKIQIYNSGNPSTSIGDDFIILKDKAGMSNVDTDVSTLQFIMHNTDSIQEVHFIGGKTGINKFYNGYIVATLTDGTHVLIGKIPMGNSLDSLMADKKTTLREAIINNRATLNIDLGIENTNPIVESDLGRDSILLRKLYPSTHKLIDAISNEPGNFIKQNIPIADFVKNFSLNAGSLARTDSPEVKVSASEIVFGKYNENTNLYEDSLASKGIGHSKPIVYIGDNDKGKIRRGGAFILYTASKSVDLQDENTVLTILNNLDEEGNYSVSDQDGNEISIDIGMLPLNPKNLTMKYMFEEQESVLFDSIHDNNITVLNKFSDRFDKNGENIRVAKAVLGLAIGVSNDHNIMKYVKPNIDAVNAGENSEFTEEWSRKLSKKLESTDLNNYSERGIEKVGQTSELAISSFSSRILNYNSEGKEDMLSGKDILSSIMIPIFRNMEIGVNWDTNVSADDTMAFGVFGLSGFNAYIANYAPMYQMTQYDGVSEFNHSFNIYNMMGAIMKELQQRYKITYPNMSSEEIDANIKDVMTSVIIPNVTNILLKSGVYNNKRKYSDSSTYELPGGEKIEGGIAMRPNVAGVDVFKERDVENINYMMSANGESDFEILETNIRTIYFPAVTVNSNSLVESLSDGKSTSSNDDGSIKSDLIVGPNGNFIDIDVVVPTYLGAISAAIENFNKLYVTENNTLSDVKEAVSAELKEIHKNFKDIEVKLSLGDSESIKLMLDKASNVAKEHINNLDSIDEYSNTATSIFKNNLDAELTKLYTNETEATIDIANSKILELYSKYKDDVISYPHVLDGDNYKNEALKKIEDARNRLNMDVDKIYVDTVKKLNDIIDNLNNAVYDNYSAEVALNMVMQSHVNSFNGNDEQVNNLNDIVNKLKARIESSDNTDNTDIKFTLTSLFSSENINSYLVGDTSSDDIDIINMAINNSSEKDSLIVNMKNIVDDNYTDYRLAIQQIIAQVDKLPLSTELKEAILLIISNC